MNNVIQLAPRIRLREIAKCLLDDDYLQKQRDRALEKHLERLERLNKKINGLYINYEDLKNDLI